MLLRLQLFLYNSLYVHPCSQSPNQNTKNSHRHSYIEKLFCNRKASVFFPFYWQLFLWCLLSKSRQNMTRGVGPHGFRNFWHVWNYIILFWVTRRFLRAIKIATESWECVLSDQKVWSTGVDLLGNISIAFSLARV